MLVKGSNPKAEVQFLQFLKTNQPLFQLELEGGLMAKLNQFLLLIRKRKGPSMKEQFWFGQLVDALSLFPFFKDPDVVQLRRSDAIMDVGSGIGLPGVVLGLTLPTQLLISNDISERLVAFQNDVINSLKIRNIKVWQTKKEWEPQLPIKVVVSRALAKALSVLKIIMGLGLKHLVVMLVKGSNPKAEVQFLLRFGVAVGVSIVRMKVPILNKRRHLIQINCSASELNQQSNFKI
ncbi:16S rRNA methyltransferase GidB [Candidatus Tremblaya phenacola PAVE]|nr:16S rRNA methyltransferase GidB [Candidatus Tremblaya phenacola PAVE]